MSRAYHTLLTRDAGVWSARYTHYSLEAVEDERRAMMDDDDRLLARDTKIIWTLEASLSDDETDAAIDAAIDAAVAALNGRSAKYGVRCQVSGEYAHTLTAWLHSDDDHVAQFDTRVEAEAEAERLTARNRPPRLVAGAQVYSYWAEEL
jgi:hypothetical protein